MKNVKISVIMGIYNCAETLAESIDSLLYQTYRDFEIIMCDDSSGDDTYHVAKQYADKYDNIILLKNRVNMGLNYTLNYCLDHAVGEYIARQDGDDISLPERFAKEIAILEEKKEIAVVSSPMIYFDSNGDFKVGKSIIQPRKNDFIHGSPFCHAPCMIRKSIIDEVGGYTQSKYLLRVEDYNLFCKIYAKGYCGYNISEPLYKMRDNDIARKRRTFRNRINEVYARLIGFKMLNIPCYYYIFCFRPILVSVMPTFIYDYFHRRNA